MGGSSVYYERGIPTLKSSKNWNNHLGLFIKSFAAVILLLSTSPHVYAHGDESSMQEMGEGPGILVTVDGRILPTPGVMSSDLSELRISVREAAEALQLSVKWDSKHHAVLIGSDKLPLDMQMKEMNMDMGKNAAMNHDTHAGHDSMSITLVLNGKALPPETDPMSMLGTITAVAGPYAEALGLHYRFDASLNRIVLQSERALKQFETEQQQVEDVLNSKGMTPQIAADGTKEFTLTAELHDWSPVQGVLTTAWTLNGQVAAPTIRVTEGDKVRIYFVNKLPEPSTLHWHGLLLPNSMDGVPYVTQDPVQPGGTYTYEFTASHAGTFIYHSHYDDMKQIGGGMYGAFIIDPKVKQADSGASDSELTNQSVFNHDYTMVLSGFHVNTTMEDEEDYFTINGRSYPDTPPITMKKGETARIRLINIDTMEPHTMHLHGMDFQVIARNGSPLKNPETMNTVLLGPGETVDIGFRAAALGDWMFHCHILDHTMNGGDMSQGEMGGLITIIKVTE